MPLYEYSCDACHLIFEALVSLSASNPGNHACPACGERTHRILSAANLGSRHGEDARASNRSHNGRPDVTDLKLPPAARLCWMDDQSAARLAAYKAGRGAEYDDTVAARKELAQQRGDETNEAGAQSDSPLSNPIVFDHRRRAAQEAKLAESAAIGSPRLRGETITGE
jgi:putative FmdB family regulatory protein